jgi:ATP-dependent helicase/nuclease subunit A
MPDLERVALALLSDPVQSGWVQERLDARVRHLLIDEFQDTSPLQWHALHAWLSAYAGAGGGRDAPSLFTVGDPKQSIYRFRRAEPRVFEAAQRFVVDALGGTLAACDHTRRCAPGVVGVLNQVFASYLPDWREHSTEVPPAQAPPLLALPSTERPPKPPRDVAVERVWRPSLTVPRVEAKAVLREAEAGAVARAVASLIREQGVAPQDILILARTNAVLMLAADALAALHLPHVAPESLRLADLPEVEDLLCVLDVLASSGQSLSLARALKSPLFGCSDAELLALATSASGGPWWTALMRDDLQASPALQRAASLLRDWHASAITLPPHDLLDRIVHEGQCLQRLAAVVPPERHARAMAAVRALLAASLELDGGRYASPYGFVRALRQRRIEAGVAAQADAVRLLTIHGAKGLEARVVLLMDCDPARPRSETATLLTDWPVQARHPRRVAFIAAEARCPPSLQALLDEERQARAREEVNALYVALTRAEEQVIVSRTPPHASVPLSWWARLQPHAAAWTPPDAATLTSRAGEATHVALPLHRRAPAPTPAPPPQDDSAARLGQAVHRMLEWAARDPSQPRAPLASAAAAAFGIASADAVLAIGSRILDSPSCRELFDPERIAWAGNEVPVASADGQVRRIDRLVRLREQGAAWWVLDYKLSGVPQHDPALREQLASYRDAVAALVPGEPVHAAFITGAGERITLDAD